MVEQLLTMDKTASLFFDWLDRSDMGSGANAEDYFLSIKESTGLIQ